MKDETERWNGNRASMSDSEHIISGNSKSTRLGPFHLQITHALLAELLKYGYWYHHLVTDKVPAINKHTPSEYISSHCKCVWRV